MASDIVQQVIKDNLRLTIFYDTDASNPREDDCGIGSRMVCFHRRYNFPNEINYNYNDYDSFEDMEKAIRKEFDIACILPVWLHDHSGLALSTGRTCSWDSGQIGFIFITKTQIRQLRGCKYVTKKILEQEEKFMLNQIDIYNKYLNGEVYGFRLEEAEVYTNKKIYSNGDEVESQERDYNEVDSCWGFYSLEDMKDNTNNEYHELFNMIDSIQ